MGIKGKNCLIIDDDPAVRALAKKVLTAGGLVAYEAESVAEAIKVIKEHVPHIILLDLNMPEIDGFKYLKLREQNQILKSIPVMVFSGESRERIIFKAIEMGAVDFIAKPLNSKILIQKIRRIFLTMEPKEKFMSIPGNARGELIADGEVIRLSSGELIFDSPLKLAPKGLVVEVDGTELGIEGVKNIGCVLGESRTNALHKGRYLTDCKIIGLSSGQTDILTKAIRGWRCE